ncbi:beta-galactosidase [Prolixibacter bellariivorans]|uniref:Beta-galactosidase n=2 Tax=Prolixibacter bellariivorans TaxID=314319 RepID=A0A5M4AU32_9BACT|nr:sugar-binding domain-containing protein [Prolixibacter bellariivorans]GET31470.1 beta-galactosidase [Prolixibacter bellariivorans]
MKGLSNAFIFALFVSILFSCSTSDENYRSDIDLSGTWQFSLDSANRGVEGKWYANALNDSVQLPGTTDTNHKGFLNTDSTTMHLSREYKYEGPAWYRKTIDIPEKWKGKHIRFVMERTKPSKVWIDEQYVGSSLLLESPQKYDVSAFLTPGKHTITVRIDNDRKLTPYRNVHIYSDDTQTNWNGIIGKIYLEASPKTYISDLQVYPDIKQKKIKVKMGIHNGLKLDKVDVALQVTKTLDGKETHLKTTYFQVKCDSLVNLEYSLGDKMDLWDEYHQPIYHLNAIISYNDIKDNKEVPFGMRKFAAEGTKFAINGRITFLRGKHDACVFPLTGYPPMNVEGWMHVMKIAKSWGINHYRFHTWSPPEAAFEAADRLGIYMESELPFWGGLESDTLADQLKAEGLALLKNFANHPSFVMLSPGNELWGNLDKVGELIADLKKADNRPLYTQGSNDNIGYSGPLSVEDFHVAARTPYAHDTTLTHVRLTQAFVDSRDGGILNTEKPSTMVNFDYPVSQIKIPLISHEVGQYQIYPDYNEIKKYTGILKPRNLEVFRNRLKKAGMLDQDSLFAKASGAWSALCYRDEIEAALRTKGLAGFQLLDLQDYPGQGTALVGMLDAFMDSKHVIARDEWRHFCNDVVPMLVFKKYCWTVNETFTAAVEVANYSNRDLKQLLKWTVSDRQGKVIKSGSFIKPDISMGGVDSVGEIHIPLSEVTVPQKLTVTLSIEGTDYRNTYPVWVYPELKKVQSAEGIYVASKLDNELFDKLNKGEKVLLFPSRESVKRNRVDGLFPPDFWNYEMFKQISEGNHKPVSPGTLGILTNPDHPLFNHFPTEFHTDWQWWSIIKHSNPLNLNQTAKDYRPIVQVIDNLQRNDKFGLIFEYKVGKGKLLVCMSRLDELPDDPAATQLYRSIVDYMQSDAFHPIHTITENQLRELI